MKAYFKKLSDLIHNDIITMNGGKNNVRGIVVLISVMFGAMGFFVSPIAGVYCPFEFGCFFVPMIFQNEQKYHSEKMYSVLPIERKDLVRSRFILTVGIYTIMSALFYILMLISMKLGLYVKVMDNEDIMDMMLRGLPGFSKLGFFNVIYFTSFTIGLTLSSSALRKYFSDGKSVIASVSMTNMKKAGKGEIFMGVFIVLLIVLYALVISGIIPLGSVALLIIQVFLQLAQTADGFLLGAVIISLGVFSMIYKYICTLLEYEVKEL